MRATEPARKVVTAPALRAASTVDMHCHSTASQESKLGVQRAVGLPECATPPQEVYELAKRRGMDFVTITDHDTIAGVLEIAERPDVFVSTTACGALSRSVVYVTGAWYTVSGHSRV